MTAPTMTLADFLLARIAEDEAPTWELIPYRCEPGCCAPAGFVGHHCLICGTEEFGGSVEAITGIAREHDETIHRRSRVLAECQAKRRIVEDLADTRFPALRIDPIVAHHLLRLLALPYVDHPDYNEAWRP